MKPAQIRPLERSEKDSVLPRRNSGRTPCSRSGTREGKLRKGREESEWLMEAVVRGLLESAAAEI
ncbi:TPA: hypothetical protein HA351_10075 [Methanosarcinaceae archaeon]|nr:hypothetical protein [Methanosarcinaceae archaeon]